MSGWITSHPRTTLSPARAVTNSGSSLEPRAPARRRRKKLWLILLPDPGTGDSWRTGTPNRATVETMPVPSHLAPPRAAPGSPLPQNQGGSPIPSTQLQGHPKPPQDSGRWPSTPAAPGWLPTLCARARGFWGPPALRGGAQSMLSTAPHLAAPSGLPCIPVAGKGLLLHPCLCPASSSEQDRACRDHRAAALVCQPRDPAFLQELSQSGLSPRSSNAPAKPACPRASPRAPGLKPSCNLHVKSGTRLLPPSPWLG